MRAASPEPAAFASPTVCPFCRSLKIKTSSVKVDAQAYWRCESCGEMWNGARLQSSPGRFSYDSRWK